MKDIWLFVCRSCGITTECEGNINDIMENTEACPSCGHKTVTEWYGGPGESDFKIIYWALPGAELKSDA